LPAINNAVLGRYPSSGWLVTGTNGENVIRAVGPTLANAYRQVCEDAAAVGMLSDETNDPPD